MSRLTKRLRACEIVPVKNVGEALDQLMDW
jgi:hypothetical protein